MMEKMDRVKQILTVAASFTVLLYAVGYITEYAHARMLGISMVEPVDVYYLISGGMFFLKTLFALFSTLWSVRVWYFIFPVVIVALILAFEAHAGEKKTRQLSRLYVLGVWVLLACLFVSVLYFTTPFLITDLLPADARRPNVENAGILEQKAEAIYSAITTETDGYINKQILNDFYTASLLCMVVSAVLFYSLVRRRKYWEPDPPPAKGDGMWAYVADALKRLAKPGFALLVLLAAVILAVQVVAVPINYGILIRSNHYPLVTVTVEPGTSFPAPDADPDKSGSSRVWLLRESADDLLMYAVYPVKGNEFPKKKLFMIKGNRVREIEIRDRVFIFKYK